MKLIWYSCQYAYTVLPAINITITLLDIIRRHAFFLNSTFRRLDSVSVFRWNLLRWAQQKELVFVSELVPSEGGDRIQPPKRRVLTAFSKPMIAPSYRRTSLMVHNSFAAEKIEQYYCLLGVTPCTPAELHRRFRGKYCLHLQG
jgi:hypothetical protein